MRKIDKWIISFCLLLTFLVAALNSCSLTTTTTWKPIERKEVPAYIERVMSELSDSCRVLSIESLDGKRIYKIECKNGAKELRNYLIKK